MKGITGILAENNRLRTENEGLRAALANSTALGSPVHADRTETA